MEIPESMRAELAAWNNGAGIDLESWIGCTGRISLAVGYTTVFWPEFVLFDGYILRKGFSEDALRGFERQQGNHRQSVEWVMNHLHLDDVHACKEASKDQFLMLGNVLKEIYQAKLQWQFPENPCTVELFVPEEEDDLIEYQISFWQKCHEEPRTR